jgi:tetratricopeptide (TPR) repeat protein
VLTLAALATATWAAFAGVLGNGSILLDDPLYVFENPHVVGGFTAANARWFLTEPHSGNWHPLTSWSHLLDVQLFGLDPGAHHAVSLALHVVNALLLALVLAGLTGAWWRSVLVAGFFALHPLRVESVAWISERKDVLSGFFFLLAIAAYRRWAARPDRARYALVAVTLAAGLMSKPMLVTLPCVLVLLDIWPLGRLAGLGPARPAPAAPARSLAGLIVEKWPLFALSAAVAVVTFVVQHRAGAVASTLATPPAERVCNALISYWRYIAKTVWPAGLAPFYPPVHRADVAGALIALAGLAAVTALAARRSRRPYLAVGWLWYVGMLVPVIGLIQVGMQAYADRYTYLPTIGLAIAIVWGIGGLVERTPAARVAVQGAALLALAALGFATARQVALWKDTRTLFTYTLAVTRDNAAAHQNLGNAFMIAGDPRGAIPHFEEALRLEPEFPLARVDLGSALGQVGRYDEAAAQFRAALRLGETADLRYDLGLVYARQGRMGDAIRECEAALRLAPDHDRAHAQLGLALAASGRLDEALVHLQRASELKPGDVPIRRFLASTLVLAGRGAEALGVYDALLAANPDDVETLRGAAWIRATAADPRLRDGAEAVRLAERASARSSQPSAVIERTLAAAYAEAGRFPEAIRASERALALANAAQATGEVAHDAEEGRLYRSGKPLRVGP